MKYSFEQFYVWYQYALTLVCDHKVKFFNRKLRFVLIFLLKALFKSITKLFWCSKSVIA